MLHVEVQRKLFLSELEHDINSELRWMRLNKRFNTIIVWGTWATRFLLLAVSAYHLNTAESAIGVKTSMTLTIAILSMANVALPLLSHTLKFQQRQMVHDRLLRGYGLIRIDLLTDQIPLKDAVERYKEMRRIPTEEIVSRTP